MSDEIKDCEVIFYFADSKVRTNFLTEKEADEYMKLMLNPTGPFLVVNSANHSYVINPEMVAYTYIYKARPRQYVYGGPLA